VNVTHYYRVVLAAGTIDLNKDETHRLPFDVHDPPLSELEALRLVNKWNQQSANQGGRYIYYL
jgi:hypothetical protein